MKLIAPDYFTEFHCIAGNCRHTCCVGWEIDVDEDSINRFSAMPDIAPFIEEGDPPHITLLPGERCPFLCEDGLCRMIIRHGENSLCQICRDHPRFRNFWSDRTEIGLGLVCEEAGRIILSRTEPMHLVVLENDGMETVLGEDETYLLALRDALLEQVDRQGPLARFEEYLLYRHLPDALYDGRAEERLAFVRDSVREAETAWAKTDGSLDALIEICRAFSYDVEYDEEVLQEKLSAYEK